MGAVAKNKRGLERLKKKEEQFNALTRRLKLRLKSVADDIYTNELFDIKSVNRAINMLRSLRDYKSRMEIENDPLVEISPVSNFPNSLLCPSSHSPMFDPVVIASGKTFERSTVENWLAEGYRSCPVTGLVLSHTFLTPNELVRTMMEQYCKENGIEYLGPKKTKEKYDLEKVNKRYLYKLLEGFEDPGMELFDNVHTLRYMTNKYETFRTLFNSADVIQRMIVPLSELTNSKSDRSNPIHEDLITAIYNISTCPLPKKLIVLYPKTIQLLMDSLTSGSVRTRLSAAGTLFLLSIADENVEEDKPRGKNISDDNLNEQKSSETMPDEKNFAKKVLGQAGAIKPLIKAIDSGHPLVSKVAADAILSLCEEEDNKDKAIAGGIVKVILEKLRNCVLVDELLALLLILSKRRQARDQMWNEDAIPVLVNLLKNVTADRNIINCVETLKAFNSHEQEQGIEQEIRGRERIAAENAIREQRGMQKTVKSIITKSLKKLDECIVADIAV